MSRWAANSSNQPPGSLWESAYTSKLQVIAVRSGGKETGQWLAEKCNVAADFRRAFGEEIGHVNAMAIMTDTDNSASRASAYYGDIFFSRS